MDRARLRWIAVAVALAVPLGGLLLCSRPRPEPRQRIVAVASETPDTADAAREVEPDAPEDSGVETDEQEFRADLADAPPFGNDETRAVCGKRKDCHVQRSIAAGTDASGRTIRLVTALLWDAKDPPKTGPGPRVAEHWAIVTRAGRIVDRQVLFRDGAAFPHDADIAKARALSSRLAVSGMRPSYELAYHGIGWRSLAFMDKYVVSLEELSALAVDQGWSHPFFATGDRRLHFEYSTASAHERWDLAACTVLTPRPRVSGESVPILLLEVEPNYLSTWRATTVAPCAPIVDGVRGGFALEGSADAKDASFAAFATSEHDVFVEITDDTLVGKGAEADSLDVWLSESRDEPLQYCEYPVVPAPPTHLRIRIADGAVSTLSGAPMPSLAVEIEMGTTPRVHLMLPAELEFGPFFSGSIALAYRDTDDGAKVERVIATSRIRAGALAELGRIWRAPNDLRCVLRDGRLERERHPRDPLRPIANAIRW